MKSCQLTDILQTRFLFLAWLCGKASEIDPIFTSVVHTSFLNYFYAVYIFKLSYLSIQMLWEGMLFSPYVLVIAACVQCFLLVSFVLVVLARRCCVYLTNLLYYYLATVRGRSWLSFLQSSVSYNLRGLHNCLSRKLVSIQFPSDSSCSAESEGYQRLQFVDSLSFLRLRGAMQADSLIRLVSQGNANKETSVCLVADTACKREKPLK